MSENCNQNCKSCGDDCADRKEEQTDFSAKQHDLSSIKKVIAVVSGKGGVGKSIITSMLAVTMQRRGNRAAIMDADITGPSIPKAFGLSEKATTNEIGVFPIQSKTGIEIMSINLLLENETDPVIWRGPLLAGVVKQFWTDVIWNDIDYMFIDMPPGTGDVPLTVFQSLKVDGIIVVTSPQELVSMIVSKAVKMAEMMSVPIVGLVENMSYYACPECGKLFKVFGESHIETIAEKHGLKILARLPIDSRLALACDRGMIELFEGNWFDGLAEVLENKDDQKENGVIKMKIAVASEQDMVTGHFGHCQNFNIYDVENKEITKKESVPNPGHKPGFLPKFLHEMGVKVIISGGMGSGAVDIFNENGIEVIVGASGNSDAAVEKYLQGQLKTTGSVCQEHHH